MASDTIAFPQIVPYQKTVGVTSPSPSGGGGRGLYARLYTPPVQDALEGTTRHTVIEKAPKLGLELPETRLTSYDLYNADEIFVIGSGAGIVGVTEVDKRPASSGETGPETRRLIQAYAEEVKNGEPAYQE